MNNAGNIVSISVENGGSGYTSAPTISFTSIVGSGATATAVVKSGKVVGINNQYRQMQCFGKIGREILVSNLHNILSMRWKT